MTENFDGSLKKKLDITDGFLYTLIKIERGVILAKRKCLFSQALILIVSLSLLTSCVSGRYLSGYNRASLKERVTAYWTYKVRGDFERAYKFEYPLYRKKVTLERYLQRHNAPFIKYNGFEIVKMQQGGDGSFNVKLKVNVSLKAPGSKSFLHDTFLMEKWMKTDGQWFHVPRVFKKFIQEKELKGR